MTENESNKDECIVCYESKAKEDFRIMKPCEDQLCNKCMKEYLERQNYTCPMCRHPFDTREHERELFPQPESGIEISPEFIRSMMVGPGLTIPGQNCTTKKPDMCWGVKETLIHVEVDENGKGHEDDIERIVGIHAASNLPNHVLIRFNPDKTSNGDKPCLKKTKLRNGDNAYKRHLPEWERRIPVLVDTVENAFREALENVEVTTGKRKLFF